MSRYIDPDKFQTLIEINQQINSQTSQESMLLENILSSSMRLIQGQASSLLLVDHEENQLYFEIALGPKGKDVKRFTLEMGQGIAGWVAKNNQSLIVNDVESDKRYASAISQDIGFRTRNILAVPMRLNDQCIGVIEILNKKSNMAFSEEDLFWLEIFANQAALFLVNNRKYNRLYTEFNTLKRQLPQGSHPRQTYHYVSREMDLIFSSMSKIAESNGSVLISGESGVGKEVMAQTIHHLSPLRDCPFVSINCASIPKDLMESELFGHEKGAFTGAIQKKVGKFSQADGGTLFLDEVGDLPIDIQAKLLRVLQEQTFTPVGSTEVIRVHIRLLSATNKDLQVLCNEGKFRTDLFYRLNVFPIHIPPLRDRPDDIYHLTQIFMKEICQRQNMISKEISHEGLEKLATYSWPGNIRQLYNVLSRSVILSGEKPTLGAEDIPLEKNTQFDRYMGKTLKEALNLFKKYYINIVLKNSKGNVSRAAKELDVQRSYLSKLIKDLDIDK